MSSATQTERGNEMKPAEIIMQQLGGGRRLSIMIGARNFFSDNDGRTLLFSFPNKKRSAPNFIQITLTERDDYRIEFGRKSRSAAIGYKVIAEYDGIYCDQLVSLFEEVTGLYLTL
jgi:hypothetical protein